jgi:hypothetical protein
MPDDQPSSEFEAIVLARLKEAVCDCFPKTIEPTFAGEGTSALRGHGRTHLAQHRPFCDCYGLVRAKISAQNDRCYPPVVSQDPTYLSPSPAPPSAAWH